MITPGLIAQLVLVGLASGAIYALIALGYSVIFSTTRIINFAQGEFLMIGALLGFTLYASLGLPLVIAALLLMVLLELFLTRTFAGKAIRATPHNPDVAALMGIDVGHVVRLSFVLTAMLTGVAGILVAPITTADANMGLILGIKGFVAVVLGGMGSARGAAAGGMAIGLLDSVVRGVLPTGWGNIAVFGVLALVLLIRPSGLFGTPGAQRA